MKTKKARPPVVADVMTQVVVTVEPDTSLQEVAELFERRHISGAPVVSRGGEVLGIVSLSDLLRTPDDTHTVLDVATRKVVSVDELTPLPEAAKALLELGIHRLVVMRNGKLAGLLTATDVLKWVARPALAKEVLEVE